MHEINMPSLGMAPGDVYLTEWMKQPGELVARGDIIALVETDKAELEVEASADGVLGRHLVDVDASAPSGSTIAWLLAPGEKEPGENEPGENEPGERLPAEPAEQSGSGSADHSVDTPIRRSDRARSMTTGELEPYVLSPRARSGVIGGAPLGASASPAAPSAPTEDRFRKAVASAVSRSWAEIPHFAVWRELPADRLQGVLGSFRALDSGVTLTDVLLKAYALSLIERFNTTSIDLGLAVATDRGVVIPVLPAVATSTVLAIAAMRSAAVGRAREGRMNATDGTTPHSSVSNLGAFGACY